MTALVISVLIVFNIVLYAVVEMFGLYAHREEKMDLTLSGMTDALFEDAIKGGREVTITFCQYREDLEEHETGKFVYKTAQYFAERYPELIKLRFVNIITMVDQDTELLVDNLNDYRTDMKGNDTSLHGTSVIFESGRNYRVITDTYSTGGYADFYTLDREGYATSYNGEEVMAAMISWVLAEEHKVAYFTQYHGEIVDIAFSNLLACAGYYIDMVDLRKEEIKEDADLLVISNPTSDFEQGSGIRTEMERIRTYAENGGNILVTLDPYARVLPVFEAFLLEHGIELATTPSKTGEKLRNIVKDPQNAITTDGFTLVTDFTNDPLAQKISEKVDKYSDGNVIVKSAGAFNLTGNAKPLLVSSGSSVAEAAGATVSKGGSYCVAAYSETATENGSSKIVAISSIYVGAADALVSNGYTNKDFLYALFEEGFGGGRMPYGCKVSLYDTLTLENLTLGTARIYTALILFIPLALAITGTVIIVRRKNR